MELAGLLSLPVEVLHNIGKFLLAEDILACSATCHYLRYTFNDNTVWEKYLPKHFKQSLQTQDLCLEPAFYLEGSLTPLCENRVAFMKKSKLVNNWKNGNFVSYAGKHSYSYYSRGNNVSKAVGQVIYKGRYLFLGRFTKSDDVSLWNTSDAIDVWDVNKVPVLIVVLKLANKVNNNYKHLYIVGDCLVVVVCVQVKVFGINIADKSFPLLFSFLITENDVMFHKPVNHPDRHDKRCYGWNYSMVDNYLFANECEDEPLHCFFHVWDIVNACKVGTFSPSVMGFSIHYHSHIGSNWFLQMKQSGNDVYFFQFNIESQRFSESILKVNKSIRHSVIYNSNLIFFEKSESDSEGWYDTVCSVYEFSSSKKLKERRLNDSMRNYQIESAKVINGKFVMLCNDGFHVIDALTLETLEQFPYENLLFLSHQFNIHGSVFVLSANYRNIYELWDVNKKERIPRDLNKIYVHHLYLNESCTKLVCVTHCDIVAYHFL